jgi:hypothetical protein
VKRPTCISCCRKHLAQARAIILEVQKGYPTYWEYAVGHMAEAEDEVVMEYPLFASLIRLERLVVEKTRGTVEPPWGKFMTGLRDIEEARNQKLHELKEADADPTETAKAQ